LAPCSRRTFSQQRCCPERLWPAPGVATPGNALGGLSSYPIGRRIPQKTGLKGLDLVRRWGSPALLLSWEPLIVAPNRCLPARIRPHALALRGAEGKQILIPSKRSMKGVSDDHTNQEIYQGIST